MMILNEQHPITGAAITSTMFEITKRNGLINKTIDTKQSQEGAYVHRLHHADADQHGGWVSTAG